ncbi:hypothetical protein LZZ85_25185 [Terrimonas sp. NA20]|uniref:Uncharacterized protein n=1 Tax=Terrimonas ginsenosidimutans TaxID=2908004 RepID=A0ABS9KZH0_9BACT|nr:hypothetical protein [Terrimonas ginsenosidimutans]MCG2617619.1 hypothetical protein [Terrimonas ginsenosidimutans]
MNETIAAPADIPNDPAPQKTHTSSKTPSSIAFAVGALLFFLPFLEIKCNNMSLQKLSGAELATGYKIKGPGSQNTLFEGLVRENTDNKPGISKDENKEPNLYALAALALGGLGLILSFTNIKAAGIGGVLTGSLAAAALIGLMIDVNRQLKSEMKFDGVSSDVSIAVDFTPWFYISIVSFALAAYFSYKRMKT